MPFSYSQQAVEFNTRLDARDLLKQIGYADEAIYAEGNTIRVFCPIHKDQVRRSLLIDLSERTFRCQFMHCPAREGGLLLGLYAMYAQVDIDEAIKRLSEGHDQDSETAALNQAAKMIESLRYAEALPILQSAMRKNPTNTITRCKLASAYLEMSEREKGYREYLAAAEDYGVKGELDKTMSIYNLLVILSPQDIKVRQQMAYMFSRMGRGEDAAEQLKWAVDQYLTEHRLDEAMEACAQMLTLTPSEPRVHGLLADLQVQKGELAQAAASYEAAGRLLMERNRIEEALQSVERGLNAVPSSGPLQSLLEQINTRSARPAAPAPKTAATETSQANEDDFAEWISSLEEEIEKSVGERMETVQISPTDARVLMCRTQLQDIYDKGKLRSMEDFLCDMFQDVKRNFEAGGMSHEEMRVIKEFYRAFCIAFEQIKRERGL
ncbi:MAG: tetratricopeptide repeat protein [Candidatus Sumerlaeota bacterium]|nr:tetratricopeptide repeat protein [Candidatus Sumerlaeota bacterium]